jgi:glycosyltransferase involved in cell wall biosynthesis
LARRRLLSPRVSVLLPVRDAARTLGACLDSLFAQTLRDFELVAVDDGSRDASVRALAEARDPRLRLLDSGGRGLSAALNAGLGATRAPLVARMDADDVAHPERLERQLRRMDADPELDVLGCRVRLLRDGVERDGGMRRYVAWQNRLLDDAAIRRDLLVESPLVHPSVMLRREKLLALGGYTEVPVPEDYELWLRGAAAGWRFGKCPEVLLDWRDGPDRLTRRDPRYGPERFRRLKLEALERGPLDGRRGVVVWGAGPIGKGWGRALRERGHPLLAFVEVAPRRLGQRICGAQVIPVAAAAGYPEALHLAAVGQPGARDRIRRAARRLGLREGRELVAVA